MYPFRILIFDNDPMFKYLQRLEQDRIVEIPEQKISKRITWELKPIRPDLHFGQDKTYRNNRLALLPNLVLKLERKGQHKYYATFKKLF